MLVYKIAGRKRDSNFGQIYGGAKTHDKPLPDSNDNRFCVDARHLYPADSDDRHLLFPAEKRDKEVQKMRENIEIADEIVTIGGIIGRVVSIKDDTVVIETASDHSKIRMARWSIQQNITATERAAQEQQAKKEEK